MCIDTVEYIHSAMVLFLLFPPNKNLKMMSEIGHDNWKRLNLLIGFIN